MIIKNHKIPNVPTPKGCNNTTPSGLRKPGIISSVIIPSLQDSKMKRGLGLLFLSQWLRIVIVGGSQNDEQETVLAIYRRHLLGKNY